MIKGKFQKFDENKECINFEGIERKAFVGIKVEIEVYITLIFSRKNSSWEDSLEYEIAEQSLGISTIIKA